MTTTETDLRTLRDHARAMTQAMHRIDCAWHLWTTTRHHRGQQQPPVCAGCVTDPDRALWRQLADEATTRVGT